MVRKIELSERQKSLLGKPLCYFVEREGRRELTWLEIIKIQKLLFWEERFWKYPVQKKLSKYWMYVSLQPPADHISLVLSVPHLSWGSAWGLQVVGEPMATSCFLLSAGSENSLWAILMPTQFHYLFISRSRNWHAMSWLTGSSCLWELTKSKFISNWKSNGRFLLLSAKKNSLYRPTIVLVYASVSLNL